MKCFFFNKITQKHVSLCFLFLLLLLIGGCGSSGGDDPMVCPGDPGCPNPDPDVSMQGKWIGSTDTQMFNEELQTTFDLTQDGSNIGGTLQLTNSSGTVETDNVNGSVSNSTITISAIFSSQGDGTIEFGYKGTVEGDTYSGDVKIYENGTDTNRGGTFSLTKNGPTPDSGPNFEGTYTMYEEQDEGIYDYTQYSYEVRIEQTGTQATLSKGNEHMTCNVVGEDLVCDGTFSYEEIVGGYLNCTYDSYTLRHDGNNGLTGEASWLATYQGNSEYGRSNLTTTRPEEGSIRIFNRRNSTFRLMSLRPCGSSNWGENILSSDRTIEPGQIWTFLGIQQGCYDVIICENVDGTECVGREDNPVNGGETLWRYISPNSLRLN